MLYRAVVSFVGATCMVSDERRHTIEVIMRTFLPECVLIGQGYRLA